MSPSRGGPGDNGALVVRDEAPCRRLLASRPVGRPAWCQAGGPVLVPVNHSVEDGAVVLVRGTAEVGCDTSGRPEPWPKGSHAATVRIRPVEGTGRRLTSR